MKRTTSTLLKNLSLVLAQNKPFVFYRKPNKKLVFQVVQTDNNIHYLEDFNQSGFVFAPFNNQEKTIVFPLDKSKIHQENFTVSTVNLKETAHTNFQQKEHTELVKNGIQYIKKNQTPKIVLSRRETVNKTLHIVNTFENLLNKYTTAFVYIWHHPKIGMWLGATPEILIQTKNKHFKTMALAGTQSYKNTLDVSWQQKEIEEHQFVSNYIFDELTKEKISCQIHQTETVKAGNLLHLQAMITGRMKNKNELGKIINALHPTPAVCGLPKETAKQFILENESYDREFYTGFLGELNFKTDSRKRNNNRRNIENHAYQFTEIQSNLFVNLRCMQVKKNQIYIYVGGGITKDSNPEKEYLETVAKAQVMKSIIQ